MDAQEFRRLMRLAWHELRTPVTVLDGLVKMIRTGRAGVVDSGVDAVLAQTESHLQHIKRTVNGVGRFGGAYTVLDAIEACAAVVPGLLVVKGSDEARIVAAPLDGFAAYLFTLLDSLPGANSEAFSATAEVLVTPKRCRVFLGPTERSGRKAWRHTGVKQRACARVAGLADSLAELQKAGCAVTFYEHINGAGLIEVRWTRPLTNLRRGR